MNQIYKFEPGQVWRDADGARWYIFHVDRNPEGKVIRLNGDGDRDEKQVGILRGIAAINEWGLIGTVGQETWRFDKPAIPAQSRLGCVDHTLFAARLARDTGEYPMFVEPEPCLWRYRTGAAESVELELDPYGLPALTDEQRNELAAVLKIEL